MACTRGSRGGDLGRSQAVRCAPIALRAAFLCVPTAAGTPSGVLVHVRPAAAERGLYGIADRAGASRQKVVGIRPGEKLHEEMIAPSDSPNTVDVGAYFAILLSGAEYSDDDYSARNHSKRVAIGFSYHSGSNPDFVGAATAWVDRRAGGQHGRATGQAAPQEAR